MPGHVVRLRPQLRIGPIRPLEGGCCKSRLRVPDQLSSARKNMQHSMIFYTASTSTPGQNQQQLNQARNSAFAAPGFEGVPSKTQTLCMIALAKHSRKILQQKLEAASNKPEINAEVDNMHAAPTDGRGSDVGQLEQRT